MRIGVIISSWGTSLNTEQKLGSLSSYAETLPNVVAVESGYFDPTSENLEKFKDFIKKNDLERIVFASCRPRFFKEAYMRAAIDVGINKYLMEIVDISELCASEANTKILEEKAKILLRSSVNRVGYLEEINVSRVPVEQAALVIGGGLVGMEAATRLADQGYKVHLVEKEPFLGGKTPQLGTVFPCLDCGNCISPFEAELHRRCMY
ncbi:MAG: NAD(P)-binding protein, partial [Promethearchaeota archaeon]